MSIALKTPRIVYVQSYSSVASLASPSMKSSMISKSDSIKIPIKTFFDLLTLTFDLWPWPRYSSTWPKCQYSGQFVCLFGRESGNTHKQTDYVKTITPVADTGCKKWKIFFEISFSVPFLKHPRFITYRYFPLTWSKYEKHKFHSPVGKIFQSCCYI